MARPSHPLAGAVVRFGTIFICLIFLTAGVQAQAERWTMLMDAAALAHQRGDIDEAERRLGLALGAAEEIAADDPRVAETLAALGSLFYERNRFAEAAELLDRALAIDETSLSPNDLKIAIHLTAQGLVRAQLGEFDAAAAHHSRALAIYREALGDDHPRVTIAMENLAGVYLVAGRYAEAVPHYARLLERVEAKLGPVYPDVARILDSYAIVLRGLDRDDEASALEARADAIRTGSD
jgi:tetratricopeptide (TPR) repeat protein